MTIVVERGTPSNFTTVQTYEGGVGQIYGFQTRIAHKVIPASNGVARNLTLKINDWGLATSIKAVLYEDTALLESVVISSSEGTGDITVALAGTNTLVTTKGYTLAIYIDGTVGSTFEMLTNDNGSATDGYNDRSSDGSYASPSDPLPSSLSFIGFNSYYWAIDDVSAGATAVLTGTANASIDEADVVAGGKTTIITLTGDTFKAAGTGAIGSTADTQALIDGCDSAQVEATGWNAEVRDKEVVGAVVRTSSTVATITWTAAASYDITAQETITVTVPTDVLVTAAGAITATPTFTVDAVVPAITDVNGDEIILDAETGVTLTVENFGSDINAVKLISGAAETTVLNLAGTGDSYTFDDIDIAALSSDTVGAPLTSANNVVQCQAADGTDTKVLTVARNPKAGWARTEVLSAVKTEGSWFENVVEAVPDESISYFPQGTGDGEIDSIAADGTVITFSTIDVDGQWWDKSNATWKQITLSIADTGVAGGIFMTDGSAAPAHFHNGRGYESDGSLAVDDLGVIDHYHQGFPFTAAGRLVVDFSAAGIDYHDQGYPFTVGGNILCSNIAQDRVASGIPFTATGAVKYSTP